MKVLHVIPSLAPCHGGPSVVLPIMERALTAEGITVETLTTDDNGPGLRNDKGDGAERRENGVIRRYFPKQTEFYKVSLPLRRWMKREVKGFDVVHIHALFSHTSNAAARAALEAGVPYIIRPLGVLNQYGITQRRALLKQWSLRWIERPLLENAAAVHFTLDAERREAELLGIPFRPVVIPLGLEPVPLPARDPESPPYVLYLSRIDPKKNIDSLLDAWAAVKGQGAVGSDRRAGPLVANGAKSERRDHAIAGRESWKLVIAGSGVESYLRSLRERAEAHGIGGSVEWAGQVAGERKRSLLANATVFTLPSHSENFGIAAAEALMAGKACVFSPGVAVGAEAARAGAALLGGPDPDSLAEALATLMDVPAKREHLGRSAQEFAARELSADVMGRRLKAMYEEVAAGHRH